MIETEPGRGLTRQAFVRRAVRGGAGIFLAGGIVGHELTRSDVATAAVRPTAAGRTVHAFLSRPDLRPPVVEMVKHAGRTAPGYLFVAPSAGPGQRGVLILDDAGEVIWFNPTVPQTAMNFRAAVFRGAPVLTWWEGKSNKGMGQGECVIVDQSYREVARMTAGGGRPADLHEFLVTGRGTALVTTEETRMMDLTSLGGKKRYPVIGSVIQELSIPGSRVLLDWRSLDHVALGESYQKIGPRFDYFHANSIDVDADGHLLVSARNTWAVYKVNRHTGAVIWRLGGKKSDFAMGRGTRFYWQHDARSHNGGRQISIFDDGAAPKKEPQSRAIVVSIDTKRRRAALVRAYTHHPPLLAKFTGSFQLLPNGDALVGWGSEPYFTEFGPDGSVRLDAKLPHGGQTYRALRFPWVGRPKAPPTLVSRRTTATPTLLASWNGATEVVSWQLLTGTRPSDLRPSTVAPKSGFETALTVDSGVRYAAVVALDAARRPLGRSAPIAV